MFLLKHNKCNIHIWLIKESYSEDANHILAVTQENLYLGLSTKKDLNQPNELSRLTRLMKINTKKEWVLYLLENEYKGND